MNSLHFIICLAFWSCNENQVQIQISNINNVEQNQTTQEQTKEPIFNPTGKSVKTRFNPPKGYKRMPLDSNSFGFFLRHQPLKKWNAKVKYYDGSIKEKSNIYCSVVDQPISPRDLQQCADAVMRMRGEYLFEQKKYSDIHFTFLSDGKPRYYINYTSDHSNRERFLKYMDWIFAFANTESLGNELHSKPIQSIEPGDVFIQVNRGTIGHAVIVMDVVENEKAEKKFMLAQSYMPAQETQILVGEEGDNSPWFSINEVIYTPEWTFLSEHLMSFEKQQ